MKAGFYLRTFARWFIRNPAIYLLTAVLSMAGFLLLFALLNSIIGIWQNLSGRLDANAWTEVNINHDWIAQTHASEGTQGLRDYITGTGRPVTYQSEEKTNLLTRADIAYIRVHFADVVFKAARADRYAGMVQLFLTDDFFHGLHTQQDLGSRFFITSSTHMETVKRTESPPRLFPFYYDPAQDSFTDFQGNEVKAFTFDQFNMEGFFTQFGVYQRMSHYQDAPLDDFMLIPFEYQFDVFHPMHNQEIVLSASAQDFSAVSQLLYYLNSAHEGAIVYSFFPTVDLLLQQIKDDTRRIALLSPIALLMLVMEFACFMALQHLSIQRNRHALAVQIAFGARKRPLLAGLLLTSLSTVLAAAGLALGIGALLPAGEITGDIVGTIPIPANGYSALFLCAVAVLAGLIAALPSLHWLRRLEPATALSEEAS